MWLSRIHFHYQQILQLLGLAVAALVIVGTDYVAGLSILGYSPQAFLVAILTGLFLVAVVIDWFFGRNSSFAGAPEVGVQTRSHTDPWLVIGALSALASLVWMWARTLPGVPFVEAFQPILAFSVVSLGAVFYFKRRIDPSISLRIVLSVGIVSAWLVGLDSLFDLGVFRTRHTVMFLLVPLTVVLATAGSEVMRLFGALSILGAIVMTASRTSSAVALVLILLASLSLSWLSHSQKMRLAGSALILVAVISTLNPATSERFFGERSDQAIVLDFGLGDSEGLEPVSGTTVADDGESSAEPASETTGAEDAESSDVVLVLGTNGRIGVWSRLWPDSFDSVAL